MDGDTPLITMARATDDGGRYERRTFLRGVGTVALAGLLAGCGTGSDSSDGEAADGGDGTASDDNGDSNDGGAEVDSPTSAPVTATPTAENRGADVETFLADTSNFDGIVDKTGTDAVTVAVGAEGNGAFFAFDPPAIRVETGTTVTWKWTGQGAVHNVSAVEDANFESPTTDEEGHTFEQIFEDPGTVLYVCVPHEGTGMKGAVVVE